MTHTILIADDDLTIIKYIETVLTLSDDDFEVISTSEPRQIFDLIETGNPDMIIIDWMMPQLSGIEVLKRLKSDSAKREIPVMMITSIKSSINLEQAFMLGAVDYIRKPLDPTELLSRVKAILREVNYKKEIIIQKKEIETYTNELERSNKDLREFSAIVSHDLKEPLRKIKFNSEQIINSDAKNKLNGEFQFVEKIKSTADRMDQLIKDLLAYSKVQTEQKDFEEVNLKEVVNGVLSDLEVRINEANGKIEVDEMPVIKADKLQMRQLFQNLISNAFKFHKESEPPVVTISSKKHADGAIEITVKDNGIGFDEKYAEKLFKPFQRLVSKSEYEGTGMGTAICKKIVEKHSGTINAKSSPNGGSTFTIKLPVLQ